MYEVRKITAEQILTVYHMMKAEKRRKEIAQATGFTVDKVKQINNTLATYLDDLKRPEKEAYVIAVKTILKEEGKEDLWDKMISLKRVNTRYSVEQLVNVWNMREKEGKSFNQINKELGISQTYMVYEHLKTLLEWHPDKLASASDNYKDAVAVIQGNAIISQENEPQTMLTPTLIVKIWQMERGHFSSRKIAELLGWTTDGSTDYVRTILRNLELYLAKNTYTLLKGKKKPYVEAREYIYKNFRGEIETQKGIYLRHSTKGDYIEAMPTFFEEEAYSAEEINEMKLKKLTQRVRREVNLAIKEALTGEPPLQEIPSKLPPEIQDGSYKGYFLEDIENYLGKEDFDSVFLKWFDSKIGGMYEGKYYVLKKDFEEFLSTKTLQTI